MQAQVKSGEVLFLAEDQPYRRSRCFTQGEGLQRQKHGHIPLPKTAAGRTAYLSNVDCPAQCAANPEHIRTPALTIHPESDMIVVLPRGNDPRRLDCQSVGDVLV